MPPRLPRKRNDAMTEQALSLLRAIAAVHEYTLAAPGEPVDRPAGLQPLLERGFAVRLGNNRAVVTPTGRAFLAGVDYVMGRL